MWCPNKDMMQLVGLSTGGQGVGKARETCCSGTPSCIFIRAKSKAFSLRPSVSKACMRTYELFHHCRHVDRQSKLRFPGALHPWAIPSVWIIVDLRLKSFACLLRAVNEVEVLLQTWRSALCSFCKRRICDVDCPALRLTLAVTLGTKPATSASFTIATTAVCPFASVLC